ncbi:MAG: hypothetical protein ACOH1N_00570 [Lutibacter sp.]
MKINLHVFMLLIMFFVLGCQNNQPVIKVEQKEDTIEVIEKPKLLTKYESDLILFNLEREHEPTLITQEEFENFKLKSNYLKAIEKYDKKNPLAYFSHIKDKDNLRYYDLPKEMNAKEYGSNSFVFGDLNNDGKRDCIVTAVRSDMYNEIHFFYVFINNADAFQLVDVACEDDISGCINGGWPSSFRYQKIEDSLFKGIVFCHYQDAHCCPSLVFKGQAKLVNNKLQFYRAEFVMDDPDFIKYRATPPLDSVLVKSKINNP